MRMCPHSAPLLLVADTAADLPQLVQPDLGHAQALQIGDRLLGALPAQVDHPHPQWDRPAHHLSDVGLYAGMRAPPGCHRRVLTALSENTDRPAAPQAGRTCPTAPE